MIGLVFCIVTYADQNTVVSTLTQTTALPAEGDPRALTRQSSGELLGSHVTFPQGGPSHSHTRVLETAQPEERTYKSPRSISRDARRISRTERASRNFTHYPNSAPARRRSETPRGRRPRELSKQQLMEKLVETHYMPSLKGLTSTNKPARAVKHQRSDSRARPALLGPLKSTRRVYISPEELEREGIKTINRDPVTKPSTETKNDEKLATIGTSIAPHPRLHVSSAQHTIPTSSGPSWATAAAAAAIPANLVNTSQTATGQTNKKHVPFKAYSSQDFRSRDRAMPTTPVDETPTPRPTTYASVVGQPTPGPLAQVRFTRAKENKISQTSRPRVPIAPQTPRWLTAPPRAWPQLRTAATATSVSPTTGGHLLPLPATLPTHPSVAVPYTIAAVTADLELLLSYSDPPTGQQLLPEQIVRPAVLATTPTLPASLPSAVPPPVISSPPSGSPTLPTTETLCLSPLPLCNIVALQQEDHGGPVPQPAPAKSGSTTARRSTESLILGLGESALGSAPLNAPEGPGGSLLLIHYEGTPALPDPIPSEVADAPLQYTMRPSASLEDLLGLDFF